MSAISPETLSAAAIRNPVETRQRDKQAAKRATTDYTKAQREEPRKAFESQELPVYALKRVATMIAGAVERGDNEVLVLHFPARFLWDGARQSALNVRSRSGAGLCDKPAVRTPGAGRDTRLQREIPIARSGRIGMAAQAVHPALVMHYTLQYM
jgi:hypothetical protein